MCSPGGSCTLNSLIKVATLRLEITVHSYSLMLSIDCGTAIFRSSFTFTWHPRRQCSCICLRVKKPTSVGRMEPPPSSTRHLHCPQEPFPPHADGRYIFCSANVEIRVLPEGTVSFLSSFIVMVTSPCGTNLALSTKSSATSRRMTTSMAMSEQSIVIVILLMSA